MNNKNSKNIYNQKENKEKSKNCNNHLKDITYDKYHDHDHGFVQELLHHFPYAIFSVALSMILLSLLDSRTQINSETNKSFHLLFHSFHFLHILFAATGTVLTYLRFSKKPSLLNTLLIGTVSPAIFCMLSDVLLPYISGKIMAIDMKLHICFYKELKNILPFLFMGIINGAILNKHNSSAIRVYSLSSHFIHILISSLASLFYLVSNGFYNWHPKMGYVFIFLVIAIVIPCTFSDVIVPMYFAKKK